MLEIVKTLFDTRENGEKIYKFSLENVNKTRVEIINYGASVIAFFIKDKDGKMKDIVLGYDSLSGYENGEKYFGAIIGRNANRIKNSKFKLNGKTYQLNPNEGENQLHGGASGFQKRLWDYQIKDRSIVFKYISEDGEEGYPGQCKIEVEYILNDEDELHINYLGTTDKDTVLNPTSHCYFNLNGHDGENILDHYLEIDARHFLPKDKEGIPTGEIKEVKNTPLDFTTAKMIKDIIKSEDETIKNSKGIDHNFCLENKRYLKLATTLYNRDKTIKFLTYTNLPGIQIYTGNFIQGEKGKNGCIYKNHGGIAIESQYYPNSINEASFESPILRVGDVFRSTTIYKIIK